MASLGLTDAVQAIVRGKVRAEVRLGRAQITVNKEVAAEARYTGKHRQKVGATPVLGGLSRPERHSAAFGAPGVAPTFARPPWTLFKLLRSVTTGSSAPAG